MLPLQHYGLCFCSSSSSAASPIASKSTSHNDKITEDKNIAQLTDNDDLFKCMNVLRCGYCRLRETSLCRLFTHWQSCHKGNEAFHETTRDDRRIVPFKFREVSWFYGILFSIA